MIHLCVFDLDGTLINSLQDLADSGNYALSKNGFPTRDVEEYRSFLGEGMIHLLQRAMGGNYSREDAEGIAEDYKVYYGSHFADHTRPYEGITGLLHELQGRGIKLAVLSNKNHHFTVPLVNILFPEIDFDMIMGKIEQFPRKPDPASLLHILQELQIKPDQVLYIGDSNIDVFTAHKAGVRVAGVSWGFRDRQELEEAGADYIVDSPAQILPLID